MAPVITVLQLDTQFPRVAGDVACPDTYSVDIEILRITDASVKSIVSKSPHLIDIKPFEDAVKAARGNVIVTSCGFLSFWQSHLASLTDKPFISSALTAFDILSQQYAPEEILTITFDEKKLTPRHFGDYAPYSKSVIGLTPAMHLRQVIEKDQKILDESIVEKELINLASKACKTSHQRLVLECTNLAPYKKALHDATELLITDILTCIEAIRPGSVQPAFL